MIDDNLENINPEYKDQGSYIFNLGKLIDSKKFEEAEKYLEEAPDKTDRRYIFKKGQVKRYLQKYDEAIEIFEWLRDTTDDNIDLSYIYLELYKCFNSKFIVFFKENKSLKKENINKFKSEVEDLKSTYFDYLYKSIECKESLNSLQYLANSLFHDKRFNEAAKCYQRIIDLYPQNKLVIYSKMQIGIIRLNDGHPKEAIDLLKEIEAYASPNLLKTIYSNLGYAYLELNNSFLAKEYLQKAIELNENSWYEYYALGKALYNLEEDTDAIMSLKNITGSVDGKKDATYFKSLQLLAKIYEKSNDYSHAKEIYFKMLNGNPKDKNIAYIKLGVNERLQGNYTEAIKWLKEALNGYDMDKAMAYVELAKVYVLVDKFDLSLDCINKCRKLGVGNIGKVEHARLLINEGKIKEANEILDELIYSGSKDKNFAIIEKVRITYYNNFFDEVIRLCSMINPSDKLNYSMALIYRTKVYIGENNFDEARNLIYQLQGYNSNLNQSYANLLLGYIDLKEENYEMALDHFSKVSEKSIVDEALVKMADIYYFIMNDKERAYEIIEKLKQKGPLSYRFAAELLTKIAVSKQDVTETFNILNKKFSYNTIPLSQTYLSAIELFEKKGEFPKMYQMCELAYEHYNNNSSLVYNLAELYFKYRHYNKAKELFQRVVDIEGKEKNHAILKIAKILSIQKHYEEATELLYSLLGTDLVLFAKNELAFIFFLQEKYEKAKNIYLDLIDTSNRNYALLQLSKISRNLGDYNDAFGYVNELLKSDDLTDIPMAKTEMARIYAESGEIPMALSIYNEILNGNKLEDSEINKDIIFLEIAKLERKLGNDLDALNCFLQIEKGKERLSAIPEIIDIYLLYGKIEEAKSLVEELKFHSNEDLYNKYQEKVAQAEISSSSLSDTSSGIDDSLLSLKRKK